MAKKKDKPQVINNIQELNLEIDYDKLAQAIVKAQNEAEKQRTESKSFVSNSFIFLVSLIFGGIGLGGFGISAIGLAAIVRYVGKIAVWETAFDYISNIFALGIVTIFLVVLGLYSCLLWKSAKEIKKEKDRNYIVSVFSGIVSFAALIVALVALFKGVG